MASTPSYPSQSPRIYPRTLPSGHPSRVVWISISLTDIDRRISQRARPSGSRTSATFPRPSYVTYIGDGASLESGHLHDIEVEGRSREHQNASVVEFQRLPISRPPSDGSLKFERISRVEVSQRARDGGSGCAVGGATLRFCSHDSRMQKLGDSNKAGVNLKGLMMSLHDKMYVCLKNYHAILQSRDALMFLSIPALFAEFL
ncbi:hypothetical protein JB92DRAFT_980705 [Gautieria morchelliformis]|nr:hypothetical protein JB92DRAFT_980705 [Gautieria morchelliformis]